MATPELQNQCEQITIFPRTAPSLINHLTFTITGNDGIKTANFILVSSRDKQVPSGYIAIDYSSENPQNHQNPRIIAVYIARAIAKSVSENSKKLNLGLEVKSIRNKVILSDMYKQKITYWHTSVTAVNAGSFVSGKRYKIATSGNTDFKTIGAKNNDVGTVFFATGAGSGTGNALLMTSVDYIPPRSRVSADKVKIGYTYKTVFHYGTAGTLTGIGAGNDNVGTVFKATAAGNANDSVIPYGFIPKINRIVTGIQGNLLPDGSRKIINETHLRVFLISSFSNIPKIVHGLNVLLNSNNIKNALLGAHEHPTLISQSPVSQGSVYDSGIVTSNDKITPYTEDSLFVGFGRTEPPGIITNDKNSVVDDKTTGLHAQDFGRAYVGRLRDRESITIDLHNSTAIALETMGKTSTPDSSMAYLSPVQGKWKHIKLGNSAGSRRGVIYSAFSGGNAAIKDDGTWWPYTSVAKDVAVAGCAGFTPGSLPVTSVANTATSTRRHNLSFEKGLKGLSQTDIDKEIADGRVFVANTRPCEPMNSLGFPSHTKYSALSGSTISMKDYIDRPFLVEKIVFETDVTFSSHSYVFDPTERTDTEGETFKVFSDIAPSGCTFFILNQVKGSPSRKSKKHMFSETIIQKSSGPFTDSEIINQTEITDVYLPRGAQKAWDVSSRGVSERFPHPQIWPPANSAGGNDIKSHAENNGWSFMQAKVETAEIGNADASKTSTATIITTGQPWSTSKYHSIGDATWQAAIGASGFSVATIKKGYLYQIKTTTGTSNTKWGELGADGSPSSGERFIAARDYAAGDGTGKIYPVMGSAVSGIPYDGRPGITGVVLSGYYSLYELGSNSFQDPVTKLRTHWDDNSYLTSDKGYRARMLVKTASSNTVGIRVTIYATFIDDVSSKYTFPGTVPVGRIDNISESWEWIDVPIFTYDGKGRKFNLSFVPEWIDDFNIKNDKKTIVTSGNFVAGTLYRIVTTGTTNFKTEQSADDNVEGTYFVATAAGTGTGTASLVLRSYNYDGFINLSVPEISIAFASMYETEEVVKGDTYRDLVGYGSVASLPSAWINNNTTSSGVKVLGSKKLSKFSKDPVDLFDMSLEGSGNKKTIRLGVPCRSPLVRESRLFRSYAAINKNQYYDNYEQDLILGWNSISRSGVDGFNSGRSPLGREVGGSTPAFRSMGIGWASMLDNYVYPGQRHGIFAEPDTVKENSPYLVYPEDNIVIGVQNIISDTMTRGNGANTNSTNGRNSFQPSVTLGAGSVKVKLYGSYLEKGLPKSNISSKENLNSKAVHQSLGDYPVEDVNDTSSRANLRNSYIDRDFY